MASKGTLKLASGRFELKNRHHKKIVGIADISAKPKGLVFIAHGLSGNKEEKHIVMFSEVFSKEGFTAIRFDTTHTFGESEGSYENATATNYYEDLEDLILWAQSQPWYQEPFCLIGHSLGGLSVALYAENHPEKVRALAPISPVVSGNLHDSAIPKEKLEEFNSTGWWVRKSQSTGLIKRLKWLPFNEDLHHYDLLKNASRLTMPVLIVVGELDNGTPPGHQKLFYDAVPGVKELHIIKGAPHTFVEPKHLEEVGKILRHWISTI